MRYSICINNSYFMCCDIFQLNGIQSKTVNSLVTKAWSSFVWGFGRFFYLFKRKQYTVLFCLVGFSIDLYG